MSGAVSNTSNKTIQQQISKVGRPARQLAMNAKPVKASNGTFESERLGSEWVTFLANSINRLLDSGELINTNGLIQVSKLREACA